MHGWLVDPQNEEAVKAINSLSYNQLVEKIIASKQDGADTELVSEGMIQYLLIIFISNTPVSSSQ